MIDKQLGLQLGN